MSQKVCPKCGKVSRSAHAFCKECGVELVTSTVSESQVQDTKKIVWCPSCGARNLRTYNICRSCGFGLTDVVNGKKSPEAIKQEVNGHRAQKRQRRREKPDTPCLDACGCCGQALLGFLEACAGCTEAFSGCSC